MEEMEATEAVEIEHHEMTSFAGVNPRYNMQQGQGSFLSNVSVTSCVISYTRFARILVYVLLIITCIPVVAGVGFTGIFIKDENYNGAIVSFFTACVSCGSASIFALHLLRKLEKYHDAKTLEGLKILGMITSVASGISLGVYTILAFFNKQNFDLHGANYFSSAVFSGLCLSTSIELFIVAQWYQNAIKANELATRTVMAANSSLRAASSRF
ncbi:uncharacterized protein NPIL_334991 [Nephila pilipes]|uniref:Transmembrane protein n=1 Tax=Nephila pilipes TaxID=299642 RepID=A0A8X6NHG3_NEPPI|nr:uncharacterized protein NPIL_334991 [Nephila pilipes]